MKHGHKGHLNTMNKFSKRVLLNPKISLLILDELEEPRFWGKREKSAKSKDYSHWFILRLEVDDEAHTSTQTHGRNRRKNSSNHEIKKRAKILQKSWKWKTLQHNIGDDLTQKHNYIGANQEFTMCRNHHNILPLFKELEGSLTFSPLLSYTMKYAHISQKPTMASGWERDDWMLTSSLALGVLFIWKLMTKLPLWLNTIKMAKLG
jgi:hypothetical protein